MSNTYDKNGAPPIDLSEEALHKKMKSEALQHPTTLLPAAASILSVLYMGLINFNETAFAVALGGGLVSLASYIFHYLIRGDKLKDQYLKRLGEKRRVIKEKKVINIEVDCRRARFDEGRIAAKELKEAYSRFKAFLNEKSHTTRHRSAQRFMNLADENYDQGVSFLQKALSIHKVVDEMDERKLRKELKSWEDEVKLREQEIRQEGDRSHLVVKALNERIKSHKRRLKLFAERYESIKHLLAQVEVLEATLDSAYLELIDVFEGDHLVKQENVAANLERAFTSARIVEDRMRIKENPDSFDDSIYAQAAKAEKKGGESITPPGLSDQLDE